MNIEAGRPGADAFDDGGVLPQLSAMELVGIEQTHRQPVFLSNNPNWFR